MSDNRYRNGAWQGNYNPSNVNWRAEYLYNPHMNGWEWSHKDEEFDLDVFIQSDYELMEHPLNNNDWVIESPDGAVVILSCEDSYVNIKEVTRDLLSGKLFEEGA